MLESWKEGPKQIDLTRDFNNLTLDIICNVTFGDTLHMYEIEVYINGVLKKMNAKEALPICMMEVLLEIFKSVTKMISPFLG